MKKRDFRGYEKMELGIKLRYRKDISFPIDM
jgi:hypothetical protein